MEARIRNAICRISIMRDGREVERGTGALVADGLVLTALHVVGNRRVDPPEPHPGECVLTFPSGQARTQLDPSRCDRLADWAVVDCDGSIDAEPIPLGELDRSGVAWESYGFPEMNPLDGMVQSGSVENANGAYHKVHAYQLFSKQAAAGDGGPASGMSGAPLIVDGAVVGLMRSALQQVGQTADGKMVLNTRGGTLYACPVSAPLERLGDLLPLPDPCRGLPGLPRLPLPEEPFRYLYRFEEGDAEIFFGRNREVRSLYDRVTDPLSPFVSLLYGQSGVGKSSVLDAGLVPRLRWRHEVRYLRRDPERSLKRTLAEMLEAVAATGGVQGGGEQSLVGLWRRAEEACGRPLVIFFDQIEEVFTNLSRKFPNEFPEFFDSLRESSGADGPRGRLLLAFRKEWYPEVQKQLEHRGLDFSKTFLEPLDHESVREVVLGLTQTKRLKERYRLSVDPGLPEMIAAPLLADATSPVAPALQVLLTKMWRQAKDKNAEKPAFSVDLYRAMQKEGVLLGDFLDQQLAELRGRDSKFVDSGLALDLLAFHTSSLLTSEQRSEEDVRRTYGQLSDEAPRRLEQLMESHLLVSGFSTAAGAPKATRLMHDTLAPLVHKRFEESERPGQRCRRLVESRAVDWKDGAEGSTLDARELKAVKKGRAAMRELSADEQRMLDASKEAVARRARWQLAIRGGFALLGAIIIAFIVGDYQQGQIDHWKTLDAEWRSETAVVQKAIADVQTGKAEDALSIADVERAKATEQAGIAERQALIATSRSLAAASLTLGEDKLDLGSLLATEAWKIAKQASGSPTGAARGVLLRSLQQHPLLEGTLRTGVGLRGVAFSPDGRALAAAGTDGTVLLWEIANPRQPGKPLPGRAGAIDGVAFSPDGRTLAAASWDNTVLLWDVEDPRDPRKLGEPLIGHDGWVNSVAFSSPDGHTLASAANDNTVLLWDVEDPRNARMLGELPSGHDDAVTSVAFSPDGRTLAAAGTDGTVLLWDVGDPRNARKLGELLPGHDDSVNSVAFSPDGHTLASASDDKTVRLWDVTNGRPLGEPLKGHNHHVDSVAFSRDGRTLASASEDRTVRLWDVEDPGNARKLGEPLTSHTDWVTSVAFSPDGALASVSWDETVRLWDVAKRQQLGEPLTGHNASVTSVAFSPDGALASASGDKTVRLWDVKNRQQLAKLLPDHTAPVTSVAFSPDGRALASASSDTTVRLWDVAKRSPLGKPLEGHDDTVTSVAFSPDGRTLASASSDTTVRLWDVANRRPLGEPLADHGARVSSVAFSRDGDLASASAWAQVLLWNIQGPRNARELDELHSGHDDAINSVAFSPDGRTLASASDDTTVRLWDVTKRQQLGDPLSDDDAYVRSVAFSPDGHTLASGSLDKTVRLWDVATRQQLGEPLTGHTNWVTSVAFSPDGRTLASASEDKTVRLWDVDPDSWAERACRRAGRNLTLEEWRLYIGDGPYHKTCPDLPGPTEAEE